jgi:hypothetical protein
MEFPSAREVYKDIATYKSNLSIWFAEFRSLRDSRQKLLYADVFEKIKGYIKFKILNSYNYNSISISFSDSKCNKKASFSMFIAEQIYLSEYNKVPEKFKDLLDKVHETINYVNYNKTDKLYYQESIKETFFECNKFYDQNIKKLNDDIKKFLEGLEYTVVITVNNSHYNHGNIEIDWENATPGICENDIPIASEPSNVIDIPILN